MFCMMGFQQQRLRACGLVGCQQRRDTADVLVTAAANSTSSSQQGQQQQ